MNEGSKYVELSDRYFCQQFSSVCFRTHLLRTTSNFPLLKPPATDSRRKKLVLCPGGVCMSELIPLCTPVLN